MLTLIIVIILCFLKKNGRVGTGTKLLRPFYDAKIPAIQYVDPFGLFGKSLGLSNIDKIMR
jgi:hypothetical protein